MIWLAPASAGSLLQPTWIMRRTGASDSAGCCRAVVAFTGFRSGDMPSLWAATSVNPAVTANSQQQQVARICSCSSGRRESAHVCFCCGLPRRPPLPPWQVMSRIAAALKQHCSPVGFAAHLSAVWIGHRTAEALGGMQPREISGLRTAAMTDRTATQS